MIVRARIPWLLAVCTPVAMAAGMVCDGVLDWAAAAVLAAPLAVLGHYLVLAYRRER